MLLNALQNISFLTRIKKDIVNLLNVRKNAFIHKLVLVFEMLEYNMQYTLKTETFA